MFNVGWTYLNPIIKKNKKYKSLELKDFDQKSVDLNSKQMGIRLAIQYNKKPNSSLYMNLIRAFKAHYVLIIIGVMINVCAIACYPISVSKFQQFVNLNAFFERNPDYNTNDITNDNPLITLTPINALKKVFGNVYGWLLLIVICQLVRACMDSFIQIQCNQMAIKFASGSLDILYNKINLISEMTKNANAQGSLANILFTDSFKIQIFLRNLQYLFQVPTELIMGSLYLAILIEPVCLVATGCIIFFFSIVIGVAALLQQYLSRLAPLRDQRSQKIIEVLNGIKVVKLFNIEEFQIKKIQNIRDQEVSTINKAARCMSAHLTFGWTAYGLMGIITYGIMIGIDKLNMTELFTLLYLLQFLQASIGFLPMLITYMQDAMVSFKRINAFIKLPEIDQSYLSTNSLYDYAIEITGGHSYAYGTAEDREVKPELDPEFYMKRDKLKIMQQQKLKVQIQQLISHADECEIVQLVNEDKYVLKSNVCAEICKQLQLPSVSYFLLIKNYDLKTFMIHHHDSVNTKLSKLYLHQCIIQHFENLLINKNSDEEEVAIIKNLNLAVRKGELVGLKGPVGSGKSSIFSAILGEMKILGRKQQDYKNEKLIYDYFEQNKEQINEESIIKIGGKIAYCPQTSPIFSMSIRENICFFKPYEEEKYNRIVDICCLLPDFEIMQQGDQTLVGGRGVTLSGGQRARIALARAVYNDADIYLLDDPLSAVDVHVGQRIWNEVIMGYLIAQGKTVFIASHQTQYFKECDRILSIENGEIMKDHKTGSQREISTSLEQYVIPTSKSQSNILHKQQQQAPAIESVQEQKQTKKNIKSDGGNVSCKIYLIFCRHGVPILGILFALFYISQIFCQQYMTVVVSQWQRDDYGWTQEEYGDVLPGANSTILNDIYKNYPGKDYMIGVADTFYGNTPIGYKPLYSKRYYYLFAGLAAGSTLFYYSHINTFFAFGIGCSKRLYYKSLRATIRTKMAYFDTENQGEIINRLVKDCESIDFLLIRFMILFLSCSAVIVGNLVTMVAVSWPTIIVIVPCVSTYVGIFMTFRAVLPNIKRIEGTTRANVFGICQETVDQLVSIRSYKMQSQFIKKFRAHLQDNIQIQWYSFGLNKWMQFRFTIIGAFMSFLTCFATVVVSAFSQDIAQYSAIIVSYGLAIPPYFIGIVEHSQNMSGEMPSVERLLHQQTLEDEEQLDESCQQFILSPAENNTGLLIQDLKMQYRPELPLALKGVNVHIQQGDHVAVVGRTGSGKSTLAGTCFRLYQPHPYSNMQLDDVQLNGINLYQARRKLAIIPQEPFLFSGTLRQQLCEFTRNKAEGLSTEGLERIPDEKLWELLDIVQMADYVRQQPGQLDCQVVGNGENFSSGQRQLICVVRALLRDTEVVLLDEATAYVDLKTDKIIQNIVKEQLKGKIVISIAHRLDTVLSMDKVLVMNQGVVAEFGPKKELYDQKGIFYELCIKGGVELE